MAQSSSQLDMQVLHDLRQRFPEIPEGVVSQCMLQNNNNLEACYRALSQESSKYLYMEYHSPDDSRMNRNHLLHINLGIPSPSSYYPGDAVQLNGGRTLVHSSSDGHIDPQHAAGKQLIYLVQEPHSAPAIVAATPNYNPFFMNEQNRSAATPPSQPPQQPPSMPTGMNPSAMQGPSPPPSYMHIPRYSTNPITVTVSQNLPSGQTVPRALQILPQIPSNLYGSPGSIYIRQTSQSSSGRQTPQSTPWQSSPQGPVPHYSQRPLPVYSHQQNYQPSQYSPKQQIPQPAYHSPPPSQCPSPFSSPQHQVQPCPLGHPSSHVFMPPSPSTTPPHPYQQGSPYQTQGSHSVAYLPYTTSSLPKGSMKKIEITVEPSQRPGTPMNRSPSPITNQPTPRNQHSLYTPTTPPSSSPSRGLSSQPKPPFSVNPVYITYTQPTGSSCAPSPAPRMIPNPTRVFKITVGRATTENLLNLVDQEERSAAPEPIQPISVIPGPGGEKGSHKYQRSSSGGSDDYAYTQVYEGEGSAAPETIQPVSAIPGSGAQKGSHTYQGSGTCGSEDYTYKRVYEGEGSAAPETIQPVSAIPGSGAQKGSHTYQRSGTCGSDDYTYKRGQSTIANVLSLLDQGEHSGVPESIQPISVISGSGTVKGSHKYQSSCRCGSDDYAYTRLYQREGSAALEPIQPVSVIPGSGAEKGSHKYQRNGRCGSDDDAYKRGRATTENLLSLVDHGERSAAPEPIQPISAIPGPEGVKGSHEYQRSSRCASDVYAYTQALLLHQRARMERLAKQLKVEKEELERLKAEVNSMEHDLMQRRLRRVSCTTSIPTPEEMTRLRSMNRQLQINVDCTLKEVDLLQSRGNFDPKAMNNFYDHIEPGPVVPPKPSKKDSSHPCTAERKARRISVTSEVQVDIHDTQGAAVDELLPGSRQSPRTQSQDEDYEGAPWNCDSCTFLNHPALNRCEQCEMPRYT